MKRRYYIILAVCSYLFFALASTPAAKVISLAKNNFKIPLQIYGVQGSIWNGQADSVIVQTQSIEQMQWSLKPMSLLLATISADIQAQVQNQNVIGQISVNAMGNVHAEDVRARINANEVQKLLALPFGELDGEFNLNIESLHWRGKDLPMTMATIKWRQAKLTLTEAVDLGTVILNIKPDDKNGLSLKVENKGGMIALNGDIQVNDKKHYQMQIDFKAGAKASANIKQSLGMFAKRQSNGSYRLKQNGNLAQLGL